MEEYKWRVKKSERGISLENFIYKKLGNWSHKNVKTAIDRKRAFVNGRNVFISKWNLKPNDLVRFLPTQNDMPTETQGRYRFIEVLHEDNYVIVCNKPAFVDHEVFSKSVADYLRRKNNGKVLPYLGQMHRLDKETTGAMVFTKKKVANTLADQFRDHSIQKFYKAVVEGRVDKEQGVIKVPLEKGSFEFGQKARVATSKSENALDARTEYRVLERYEDATLVDVEIKTGRTHQIRVHFDSIGHPLIGDKLYGDDSKPQRLNRQALHAERLFFKHPVTRKAIKIQAPLPKDFARLVQRLRGIEE